MDCKVLSFSTFFMFLAVSSFAFTAVHSIKSSLLDFFNRIINKLIKMNKARQSKIFNFVLSKASVDFLDDNDSLLEDIDELNQKLKQLNNITTEKAEKILMQIFKKYRLVSFGIGLQAFFLIIFAGLYGSHIIDKADLSPFYIFISLSSLYIIIICKSYKNTPKREVLYNFSKVSSIIVLLFLFSISLRSYGVNGDILVFFIAWLVIQFILFTVILPLYVMEKKIVEYREYHDNKRDNLWEEYETVNNAKRESEYKSKEKKANNKVYLNNFNRKMQR